MLYNDDNVMEPTKPSVLPDKDEKRKRATTINEGKKWAGDVNEENAWDRLVLTLGEYTPNTLFYRVKKESRYLMSPCAIKVPLSRIPQRLDSTAHCNSVACSMTRVRQISLVSSFWESEPPIATPSGVLRIPKPQCRLFPYLTGSARFTEV